MPFGARKAVVAAPDMGKARVAAASRPARTRSGVVAPSACRHGPLEGLRRRHPPVIVPCMRGHVDDVMGSGRPLDLTDDMETIARRVAERYGEVRRTVDTTGTLFARHELQSALIEVRRLRRRLVVAAPALVS